MKRKLAEVLTEYMKTVSLEKITVKDIVERAGVSRQTFYYHFHDIYEVLEWYMAEVTNEAIKKNSEKEEWIEGYTRILCWCRENKPVLMNIYSSVSRDTLEFYMNQLLYGYMIKRINYNSKKMKVSEKQKEMVAKFYTMGINAITLEWMRTYMKEDPEELAAEVYIMLKGGSEKALSNFEYFNNKNQHSMTDMYFK